ncbi:MAG TPA: hypothetical protein PKJ78_05065 [Candidatus Hydrogenedentes bacterium]|nr:hypothetical protein [Candidatus Hydrogenedentota bacterium]
MAKRTVCAAFLAFLLLALNASIPAAPTEDAVRVKRLAIVTGSPNSEPENKAADILKTRILKRSSVTVQIAQEDAPDLQEVISQAEAVFVLGIPGGTGFASRVMHDLGVRLPALPGSDKIHPESFAVKTKIVEGPKALICVAGADERGMLYGVGYVLRAVTCLSDALLLPRIDAQDKPAFPLRGGRPTGPGSRARQFGNLRPQTPGEMTEVMEDLMLLGCNIFEGEPASIRAYGMLTTFGRTANEMPPGFPAEWRADGGRAARYVCPSVPEARKALLESFDQMFKDAPDYDFFTTNSGDEGGCRCEKCMPWGDKYIALVHDIAGILHTYHPRCKVLATNQDLTNEGNRAIFEYLNHGDTSWLYAIRYGPGADEMQTYIRGPVNPQWFEYEGFGPLGNYLKFMHHELPPTTNIVLYSDITHWMQAQFAVPHPDVALAAVYDRRSWNARPRNFHKVGQEILHYALGDMHYSEGMHDDFNKWFWYRLLWNPHQDAESITREYCRYWFGPEAQEEAAQAIFLMEETLEKPVAGNPGIARAVELLHAAGAKIPPNLLKTDYRWRIILEKALMDRYIQLELERGHALKGEAGRLLADADASHNPAAQIQQAVQLLEQPIETDEMRAVMAEALELAEEANTIIGYREPAPFIVPALDLTEIGWWTKVLRQALARADDGGLRNAAKMLLYYDEPGAGGFYDDVGWPNESPHLVAGEALWGFNPFPGPAKLSHYNLAYSMRTEAPVAFRYDGLDPSAQYVVRISVGAHLDGDSSFLEGVRLTEGLKADDTVISDGFDIPTEDMVFHEFEIPKEVSQDGMLNITLVPGPGPIPVTGCAEIWLLRKGNMPWSANP